MIGSIDLNRFVLGEIKNETVGANCGPQAMTAADRYERSAVFRGQFYLLGRPSVSYTIARRVDLPLSQRRTRSRPVR